MLRVLHQKSNNPYFNIATEEYLLKHKTDDYFVLYRNNPSIIVGKHQNTNAEINHSFVEVNGIPVVRRLTGGGTVYHDLGNINFSFIVNGVEGQLVDFYRYTSPVIDILNGFGVNAYLGGKNDIRVGDKKISGNAEHVYRNRVLHHGTLLFQSNLETLNEALSVNFSKYSDKAVKSVRSAVANVSDIFSDPVDINFFEEVYTGYIHNIFPECEDFCLSEADISAVEALVASKYGTWEWNYGYSPSYRVSNEVDSISGKLMLTVIVSNGYIDNVQILNADFFQDVAEKLKRLLIGKKHRKDIIAQQLGSCEAELAKKVKLTDWVDSFF